MSLSDISKQSQKNHIDPPKQYGVFLLNDDETTMDFVVQILIEIFSLPENHAINTMLAVHHHGKAICGVYTRDIALTKQQMVHTLAENAGFPLECTVEVIS